MLSSDIITSKFSLRKKTLRKMTFDNSVKYIPQSEQRKVRDDKPNTIKKISLLKKRNKKFSPNSKKFVIDNVAGEVFGTLK